ncbi:MAG: hypothetical protein A2Z27_05825 [candidate division Zixibacteria bacterium RBG_16_50_21]|nr:MAG: hypothetical protein A2Z27_05825 [candidate division Zixibacteria bacterium RBG_16_50_21]
MAVTNFNSSTVSVFKNNGNGTFAAKVDYGTGVAPASVFASDLDGDTDIDLEVANANSNTVSVLKNNGSGTFAAKVDYATGTNPYSVFASDLDGDTDKDLAVANKFSNTVSVLKNNGNGTFAAKVDYATGTGPISVFTSDLDGDTDNDLAVANYNSNTVSVLMNLTPPFRIISITDVPNDQGRQVRIRWRTANAGDTLVKKYDVFRRIDEFAVSTVNPLLPDWEQVATFSAYGDTLYNGIVPTLVDSTAFGGLKWSVFFIRAATNSPPVYFDSPIDSGYSVDNLVPSPPANLQASSTGAIAALHWSPVSDEDFDFYYVYRDTVSGFSLSPGKRVKATSDTLATDSLSDLNKPYYYQVTAVDFSGNESPASNQAQLCSAKPGDANASNTYTLGDIISIVNYIFNKPGCVPTPVCWLTSLLCRGDWNGSGTVTLGDAIQGVNYIFTKPGGPWNALPSGVCCL